MPVYRYKYQGPLSTDLSREVPGTVTTSASDVYFVDISAVVGSKQDLDDAMLLRGYVYISQDPANTPLDESGTQSVNKINVQSTGTLVAKQPSINFIGSGVTAVNNAGSSRVDITIPGGATLTSAAPQNVNTSTAAVGVATDAARADHKHNIDTATPTNIGTSNTAGTSTSLVRADHVHALSFATVNSILATANAAISINSQNLQNVLDPVLSSDAATKNYVDSVSQGLDVKASVRVATTAALPSYAATGSGATKVLTASANGALVVDGYTPVLNERVLVKDQAASSIDHGIYTLTTVGTGSNPWVLTRASDSNTSAKVTSGLFTFVETGTTNASAGFVLSTASPITIDSTAISFSQFSGAGQVSAGAGLQKVGNTISVNPNADGSIVTTSGVQVGVLATDAQHGTRGGGTLHANVVASGASGFMSGADKAKLDSIPATPASGLLLWGNSSIGTSTTTRYLSPGYVDNQSSTNTIQFRVPKAGTIRNVYVRQNTIGSGSVTLTYTVRKNSVATALVVTVSSGANDANNTANSFTVAAGDLLDVQITKASNIATSPQGIVVTCEYAA